MYLQIADAVATFPGQEKSDERIPHLFFNKRSEIAQNHQMAAPLFDSQIVRVYSNDCQLVCQYKWSSRAGIGRLVNEAAFVAMFAGFERALEEHAT